MDDDDKNNQTIASDEWMESVFFFAQEGEVGGIAICTMHATKLNLVTSS